ncbi:MAG: hypothetical protein LH629_02535, partial [Ignavibacteria bacterium]|nr:hypothetical protein [Ignavibacteria bacterium]
TYIFLGWYAWPLLVGYLGMIYLGWLFVAANNYGQHLHVNYGLNKGNSYLPKWYNKIFINNFFSVII